MNARITGRGVSVPMAPCNCPKCRPEIHTAADALALATEIYWQNEQPGLETLIVRLMERLRAPAAAETDAPYSFWLGAQ